MTISASTKKLLADVAERTAWTFAQAFAGVLTADAIVGLDVAVWKQALAAGIGAALAVIKGFVASQAGKHGTASSLPESIDPTPVPAPAPVHDPNMPGRGPDPAP